MKRLIAGGVAAGAALILAPFAFSGHTTEAGGLPVLIKTKLRVIIPADGSPPTQARGRVLRGSFIGERSFCPGRGFRQTLRGVPPAVTVTSVFRCREGTLRIRFKPRGPNADALNQSGLWRVLSGTGRYRNLRPGHGSIFVRFDRCCPTARETFAGTVANR